MPGPRKKRARPKSATGAARPADAGAALQARIAADPDDAVAHYQLGILQLAEMDMYRTLADPVLAKAQRLLQRAVELHPSHAFAHAALGLALSCREQYERALEHFRASSRLDPKNRTFEVNIVETLLNLEREQDALAQITAMASRHGVKVAKLKAELARAKFPADAQHLLMNGFIHPGNFLRSALVDEADRIRNSLDRGRKRRVAQEELERCKEDQRALARDFDRRRVPAAVRALAGSAVLYGIGDDYCRPVLMKRIPKKDRAKLIRLADKHAAAIDKWLNTFAEGRMTTEAAAFMYLMNGVEEIR
jgi:tetratricopeptide (TPR) repeat protein